MIDGRVHVRPYEGYRAPGDSSTFIADFDGDVFFPLRDDDLCHGEILFVLAMSVHDRAQAVFQRLEQHMRQVSRHVHEVQVVAADELYLWRIEQSVVILADEARVFYRFERQILHVGLGANNTHVVGVVMGASVLKGDVLADEHAYPDTGHVEAVEEGLDGIVDLHALSSTFVFEYALCHGRDDAVVPALDTFQRLGEAFVVVLELGRPVAAIVIEGRKVSANGIGATSGGAVAVAVRFIFQRGVLRGLR